MSIKKDNYISRYHKFVDDDFNSDFNKEYRKHLEEQMKKAEKEYELMKKYSWIYKDVEVLTKEGEL